MVVSPFIITNDPLKIEQVVQAVYDVTNSTLARQGAVTSFIGQVRGQNLGKQVLRLEYEAYKPLAIKTFERIETEAQSRWPGIVMALHHRLGVLAVGETSVAIAVSSPHRAESFVAMRLNVSSKLRQYGNTSFSKVATFGSKVQRLTQTMRTHGKTRIAEHACNC